MIYLILLLVLVLVVIGILKFVKDIADDVRKLRNDDMPRLLSGILRQTSYKRVGSVWMSDHDLGHVQLSSCAGSAVIWVWRGGRWVVEEAPAGVDPGLEPNYAGAFDGDMATAWISDQR